MLRLIGLMWAAVLVASLAFGVALMSTAQAATYGQVHVLCQSQHPACGGYMEGMDDAISVLRDMYGLDIPCLPSEADQDEWAQAQVAYVQAVQSVDETAAQVFVVALMQAGSCGGIEPEKVRM